MILLLFACFIIFIVPFLKVSIRINYLKNGTNDELIIIFSSLFGLINVKREINVVDMVLAGRKPAIRLEEEIEITRKGRLLKELERVFNYEEILNVIERVKNQLKKYNSSIQYFKKKIIIRHFNWETGIGIGDAALTGIATGLLWNVKNVVIYILNTQFRITDVPAVNIRFDFERIVFTTQFDCIFSFKIGHAIIAGLKGLIAIVKDGG